MTSFITLLRELPQLRLDAIEAAENLARSDVPYEEKEQKLTEHYMIWMDSAKQLKEHAVILNELTKLRSQRLERQKELLELREESLKEAGAEEEDITEALRDDRRRYREQYQEMVSGGNDANACVEQAVQNEEAGDRIMSCWRTFCT